ncbi:MAG: hypothetical protein PHC50_03425 [Candidatus Cloacimonetes bacterium]|nr:hypothetical protein [Candidatus Cloacimonadota bacterium]
MTTQAKASRSLAKKELQSMPDNGIPFVAAENNDTIITGSFSAITIFNADFPEDEDSIEINGIGVDLSPLNDFVPDGFTYLSHFTKITIPAKSDMVLIVYGF